MTGNKPAQQALDALRTAEHKPAPEALTILNGLMPLVQSGGEEDIEADEARAGAFLAICEVGKALHRGQPTDTLYAKAIDATQRWAALVR